MLSQFIKTGRNKGLGDLNFPFADGTFALGRLDKDSEGLLLLTTNNKLVKLLYVKNKNHKRTYLAQVDNSVSDAQLEQLKNGVFILGKKQTNFTSEKCEVQIVEQAEEKYLIKNNLHPRLEYTWLLITLGEGKYRQVRKMIMAIGHKCKRLKRVAIEDLHLGDLAVGEVKEISEQELLSKLNMNAFLNAVPL